MLTFKIENETDLHVKVVSFLKKRYPQSLFTITLGENQRTSAMRIESHRKGYLRGSPDLIINNLHKHYTGSSIGVGGTRPFSNIMAPLTLFNVGVPTMRLSNVKMLLCWPSGMHIYGSVGPFQ